MSSLASRGRALLGAAMAGGAESDDDEYDSDLGMPLEDEDFEIVDAGAGEGFMAVKPWIGAMVCPSEFEDAFLSVDPPSETLQLDWVFGYSKQGRSNTFALPSGEIVWPSGAVGVIYDKERHSQRHLIGHEDTIYAMAQNPANPSVIATGGKQEKRKALTPLVIVWDTDSGKAVAQLRHPKILRSIMAMCFSPDGRYVIAVGGSDVHNVVCYDIAARKATSIVESGRDVITQCYFNKFDGTLVTAGAKHLQYYSFRKGMIGDPSKVRGMRTNVYACVATKKTLWVGVKRGDILCFANGSQKGSFKGVHKGNTLALAYHEESGCLVSGGSDGLVNVFVAGKVKQKITVSAGGVSSLSFTTDGTQVIAGTKRGEVLVVNLRSGQSERVCKGHFDGETWGLAIHPFENFVVTTGDDNSLNYWNMDTCQLVQTIQLVDEAKKVRRPKRGQRGGVCTTGSPPPNQCSRACAFDAMGEMLAVGMNDGSFMVLDIAGNTPSFRKIAHKRGRGLSQWVQDLKFNPLDPILAVGTHDNVIDLWQYDGSNFSMSHRLKGHNSFITHLDWSTDGQYLQSNCGAYELLYWDAVNGSQITRASSLKDQGWETWTCVLGWPVQGIWAPEAKGCDVHSVSLSSDKRLLVAGESSQKLKLFNYPVPEGADHSSQFVGHGSFVTNVRFSKDDEFVYSTGGNDNALMRWRVCS